MPRTARNIQAGLIYQVLNRGNGPHAKRKKKQDKEEETEEEETGQV